MSAVSYSHYHFQTVKTHEEFCSLYNAYESIPEIAQSFDEDTKIQEFVRELAFFEMLAAFFELVWESICSRSENPEVLMLRNQAWDALLARKWIRRVKLEIPSVTYGIVPVLPSDINSMILINPKMSLLGICCRVCKSWKNIFSQDFYWKPFFSHLQVPKEIRIKDFFDTHSVGTEEQLYEKVKNFADTFQFGQCKKLTLLSVFKQDSKSSEIIMENYRGEKPPRRHEVLIVPFPLEKSSTYSYRGVSVPGLYRFFFNGWTIPFHQRKALVNLVVPQSYFWIFGRVIRID